MLDSKSNDYKNYIQRISSEKIPAYSPLFTSLEEEYLKEVIGSGWLSEGKFTRRFEEEIALLSEKNYALATTNGTAALMIGMLSLGLKSGDEVIVPSLSHSADPNSVASLGLVPVFCDVSLDTLCLNVQEIEKVITKKTRAVLNICAYGSSDNLEEISDYCKRNNLKFINDCAPALGCFFRGKPMASYGDISMHSFFADKTITTGEGGMLLTNDAIVLQKANIYKHDGRRERGHDLLEEIGYNFRVTELQSAIGVAQLQNYLIIREKKIAVHNEYKRLFNENVGNIKFYEFQNENTLPHRNIIFVENANRVIEGLSRLGIGARTLFMPMNQQPIYGLKNSSKYPNSDHLFKTGVCLPSGPTLSREEIERVYMGVKEFA
jgi:perosamine synthetase